MPENIYEKAKQEADMWLSMGQGLLLQGLESYPEKFEQIPGIEDVPESIFSDYLNPHGDKLVHLGAFYGGSKLTMKTMEKALEEPSEEALMAGAFLATTVVGSGVEYMDPYFDMADMAANYAGWYLASENHLEQGPTEKAYRGIKEGLETAKDKTYRE